MGYDVLMKALLGEAQLHQHLHQRTIVWLTTIRPLFQVGPSASATQQYVLCCRVEDQTGLLRVCSCCTVPATVAALCATG